MNNTVTLSALITRLAKVADTDINTSRRFLRAFFGVIEKELAAGESVSVKGIGTFHRSTDPTFGTPGAVRFIPEREFAGEVNAPFSMFEAVELADGVTFKEEEPQPVQDPESESEIVAEHYHAPRQESVPAPETAPAEPEQPQTPAETQTPPVVEQKENIHPAAPEAPVAPSRLRWPEEEEEETLPKPKPAPKPIPRPAPKPAPHPVRKPVPQPEPVEEEAEDEIYEGDEERRGFPWWFWIAVAVLLIGGGVLGYYFAMYEPSSEEKETVTEAADSLDNIIEEVQVADLNAEENAASAENRAIPDIETSADTPEQPAAAPAAPAPAAAPAAPAKAEPVYDTVTRSLAQLAKKHYGNTNYWVFIYKTNEATLGNPDHISAGTRVLIPAKESFEGATPEETKQKARAINNEITNKYKR